MKTLKDILAARRLSEREAALSVVTPMEREIWRRYASGESRKQIASDLGNAPKTVDNHIESLRKKLGVACSVDLVRAAVRYGVITVEVVE